uniref:Uncharacterized protein n=1 Tax=Avena sativa TaxID=4498 RepID=A0ACD5XJ93_AVESA
MLFASVNNSILASRSHALVVQHACRPGLRSIRYPSIHPSASSVERPPPHDTRPYSSIQTHSHVLTTTPVAINSCAYVQSSLRKSENQTPPPIDSRSIFHQARMCPLRPGTSSSRATNMSRIHPSDRRAGHGDGARRAASDHGQPAVYTVWKRSSMGFQGTDGFSVYDAAGRLAFRVDNYARRPKAFAGELLLMDGRGAPLLSLRPQILSLRDRWNCYRVAQEEDCLDNNTDRSSSVSVPPPPQQQQLFTMRKCAALQNTDDAEVHMSPASMATTSGRGCRALPSPPPGFRVEGCFSRRSCKISGSDGQEAARITRKKTGASSTVGVVAAGSRPVSLGDDVFTLVVRPGLDAATVMAIVVVMDRICRRPYAPMACSAQ